MQYLLLLFALCGVVLGCSYEHTIPDTSVLEEGNYSYPVSDDTSIELEVNEKGFHVGAASNEGLGPFFMSIQLKSGVRELRSGAVAVMAQRVKILDEIPKSEMPDGSMKISMQCEQNTRSSFSFVVENPLTIKPNVYDLRPGNTSFGVYFMLNVTETRISWFVKRRPPIPGFIARITDDKGQLLSRAPVNNVPADGIGFVDVIKKDEVPEGATLSNITLSVEFFEFPRRAIATAKIDLDDSYDDAFSEGGLTVKSGHKAIDFKVTRGPVEKELNLLLVQHVPIQNLLIRVRENGAPIFAEAESNIPFIQKKDESTVLFGWNRAIRVDSDESELTIEAIFDTQKLPPGTSEMGTRVYDVFRFVQDHGGNIGSVTPVHKGDFLTLKTTKFVKKHEVLFSVPFRLLLQHQVCENVKAIKNFLADEDWIDFAEEKPAVLGSVISMALCAIMKPTSPYDGTNWRVVFDSFHPQTPDLPMLWPQTELDGLLHWATVKSEIELQRASWKEEHGLIDRILGKNLTRRIPFDEYAAARGHMLSKLINVSGSLVLPPLVGLLHHDDDPSAAGLLDHERRQYIVYSLRDVAAGEVITVDKGAKDKFKAEFFVHFGSVPHGAVDSIAVGDLGVAITLQKRSRFAAVSVLKQRAREDETDVSDSAILNSLLKILRDQLSNLPSKVDTSASKINRHVVFSERLLRAERNVLETQIAFIEDDLSEL